MKLFPTPHQSTWLSANIKSHDWLYDRSHRIWTELLFLGTAYPVGFLIGLFT